MFDLFYLEKIKHLDLKRVLSFFFNEQQWPWEFQKLSNGSHVVKRTKQTL